MLVRSRWLTPPEYFIPPSLLEDPEEARRARLIVGFGLVGGIFGTIYAAFYLLIEHVWGALIIVGCTVAMASVPWLLRRTANLTLTGNLHSFILVLGFCGLSAIEGGVNGHAIAWLASIPLCALLLVNVRAAIVWCGACFLATLLFCVLEWMRIEAPIMYPARWHSIVTAAGFLGLTIFMAVIGVIFELGRKKSFRKMQDALQELSETNIQLVEISAEKDELLGIAAHDLKNPLSVITGFATLIRTTDRNSMERIERDAGEIIKASTHMHRLVSDLLDLHAIEDGKFPLKLDFMDLGETVSSAAENQRSKAEEKRLELHYLPPPQPVLVKADMRAVLQILDNLVSNAIKFSPKGKEIFLRVKGDEKDASFEIQDQGPGLTDADRKSLFEKFARLSARPTGGETSNGLGLSIVKKLIETMGGSVQCRSKHGDGATFIVNLKAFSLQEIMDAKHDGNGRGKSGNGSGNLLASNAPESVRPVWTLGAE